MLSSKLQKALNEHINKEIYSAYYYLAMSAYCEEIKMTGAAHWFRSQSGEEWGHAMKMFAYVNDRGGRVELMAIEKPPVSFKSLLDVFQKTLEHEKLVTSAINDLYGIAAKDNDYATQSFLKWFIDEQVEEEKTASELVDQLTMLGDSPAGLIMLDRHLASR